MSSSVADRTDEFMPDAVIEGLSRSLFDLVGGTAGVNLIVDNLLERLLSDAELAALLAATDVASLKQSQAAFFEAAFGGRATDSQTARLEVDADELFACGCMSATRSRTSTSRPRWPTSWCSL